MAANLNLFPKPQKSFKVLLKSFLREISRDALATLWISFLALPLVVFKINTSTQKIDYLWGRLPKIIAIIFICTLLWRIFLKHRSFSRFKRLLSNNRKKGPTHQPLSQKNWNSRYQRLLLALALLFLVSIPFWNSPYLVMILITALIYITLGLGLNIVVGISGLLNLGYVAFYAIGAYTFALLHQSFGLGFWTSLPVAALAATFLGLLLALPILRLSGDYLAIVTLGFAEIVRLVLVNMDFTQGPRGIKNIPSPSLFGLDLNGTVKPFLLQYHLIHPDMDLNKVLIYFVVLAIVILTIICVGRLENSRLGRAWLALREDEVACQAMGINRSRAKLLAFALGSTWAGLAGVVFAAQLTFVSPSSFTFMESVMILSIVVLGGMGSIPGVIVGAFVLILLPEYLRQVEHFRMLLFGLIMVVMMVFRPGGLIQSHRKVYIYKTPDLSEETHLS
ncbi:MAG: high-affinity branched-chain amino acid ABC transporter permease LivM [Deltaproteobacteria bacterium]|nr:high-affinity branched-chain amino acid ABC transporter permease LivM [Deltaproteobacteria bacterium]